MQRVCKRAKVIFFGCDSGIKNAARWENILTRVSTVAAAQVGLCKESRVAAV